MSRSVRQRHWKNTRLFVRRPGDRKHVIHPTMLYFPWHQGLLFLGHGIWPIKTFRPAIPVRVPSGAYHQEKSDKVVFIPRH